ncbi:MAG: hypothetical protein ABIS09_08900, partial [Sphingomicrobium sp.]
MCARRFLMVVFVMILLVVAGGFAIFQFGGRVLVSQAVPTGHFAQPAGTSPDYALSSSWLSRPGLTDDPAQWLPDGLVSASTGKAAI